jgi:phage-related protein
VNPQAHNPQLDFDVSMLFEIDVNALTNSMNLDTVRDTLRLEDLDRIDWDLVVTSVLGVTDPIGQIVSFLTGLLNSLFDSLRSFIDSVLTPIRNTVDAIYNMLFGIRDALSSLANMVRGVVVTPILDALRFVSDVFPRISSAITSLLETISRAIEGIPSTIRDMIAKISGVFTELVDRVRAGFDTIISLISRIPDVVRDIMARISDLFSDFLSRARAGFDAIVDIITRLGAAARDLADRIVSTFTDVAGRLRDAIDALAKIIMGIPDAVRGVIDKIITTLSDLFDKIRAGISGIADFIAKIPDTIRDILGRASDVISKFIDGIRAGLEGIVKTIATIPDAIRDLITRATDIVSRFIDAIRGGLEGVSRVITGIPDIVRDVIGRITSFLADLLDRARASVESLITTIARAGDVVRDAIARASESIAGMLDRVANGVRSILDILGRVPETIKGLVDAVSKYITDLLERARAGITNILDVIPKVVDSLRDLGSKVATAIADIAGKAHEALSRLIDALAKTPDVLKTAIDRIIGDITTGVGGVVEWVRRGFRNVTTTLEDWFKKAGEWFGAATTLLKGLSAAFMGFVNAVSQLPDRFGVVFESLRGFASRALDVIDKFIKDPIGWFNTYIIGPLLNALNSAKDLLLEAIKASAGAIAKAFEWLWGMISNAMSWFINRVVDLGVGIMNMVISTAESIAKFFEGIIFRWAVKGSPEVFNQFQATAKDVEAILQASIIRTAGVAENLWLLGGGLLIPYWRATLVPLVIRGVVRAFGDFDIAVEPSVAGTKAVGISYRIKASELADALARGFEAYVTGYAIGASMAIANTVFVNIQHLYVPRVVTYYDARLKDLLGDLLKEEFEAGASVNMFTKPVSETALIDYARRSLALSEGIKDTAMLRSLLATVRAHLKIYGLPKWYVEWLTKHPEELKITFIDRFGASRRLYLSHIFELPTHSEMARMTQRDIFPGVDVMKRLGWVRGWNEDLTTMIYLLTFKYPSFEKLWTFYMRALSGMLWFKAPEHIKAVFDREAEEVGAGKPISPLDIQKALTGPDQVKAFETALNTYFKWIEYSNFSWFTDKTTMYGINIGAEVVGKLGGWTADSWLMVDVAADIPTKIDMRWMSRFGIFLHMAEAFEAAGVRFENYAPLVGVVPKLLEPQPATPIQVDLRWFSKLLQATGLHPAWVPVTTVAENIMVIADEMTLLRTGWLNLFKEGMITVEDAERYLSGLLVASYRVGYWDPEKKVWTSGWINLPVRWLPHERRLLQLRMAIDRAMDVFREIYSYIRSGIRTIAITPEEGLERLRRLVDELDKHYRELTKKITGVEMVLRLDEGYAKLWLELQRLAQDIEAVERVRIWWSRVSGWLLYRIAYGWVTNEEIETFISTVGRFIPLHPKEVEAYKEIAKALVSIARKENIPSPSTLATFAEYMVVDVAVTEDVLVRYNVPKEYWGLWKTYIQLKPVKSDFKAVINVALRALRYGAIPKDEFEKILEDAKAHGFTPPEIDLIRRRAELEHAIDEAKLWRPSILTLIGIIEYVPEAVKLLEHFKVDPIFRPVIEKYALVKPLADEARILINSLYRAKRYIAVPKELEDKAITTAKSLGITDVELSIRDLALELQVLADEARAWAPSPSAIATLSEYVTIPRVLIETALRMRRIPEEWAGIWIQYISVKPVKPDYRAVLMAALKALRYNAMPKEQWDALLRASTQYGFTPTEVALLQLRAEIELMIEEAKLWRPSISTLIAMIEYVPEAVKLLEHFKVDPVFRPFIEKYARVKPLADEARVLINALYRAKRYVSIPADLEKRVIDTVKTLGITDDELMLRNLALELTVLVDEARTWIPSPATIATLSEYVTMPRELVESALRARRIPDEWMSIWLQYIAVRPLKPDYKAVISTAIRALRFRAITDEQWKQILERAKLYGFTDQEVSLIQLRAELEMAIEEAREFVPTPSMLATIAEIVPEARRFIPQVFEARRIRGAWAEIWAKYIHLRPIADDIRRFTSAAFNLAERLIIPIDQLKPVFEMLKSYGWEDTEIDIAKRAISAIQVRNAFTEAHGSARALAGMARHSDKAADLAYNRALKLIEALPVDNTTKDMLKQMWRDFIIGTQVHLEARSYIGELVAAYGDGVIDDATLDKELEYLKKLGVPEARLALVKRQAVLRRARRRARLGG